MKTSVFAALLCWMTLSGAACLAQQQPVVVSESNYFGADLTRFPPEARKWIMTEAFTVERMTQPFMIDSKLAVEWSDDGNSLRFEASYVMAPKYQGAGNVTTWGQGAYYTGDETIYERFGEHAKYHTMKFRWSYRQSCRERLSQDEAYAQVIAFASRLCDELEYDWGNFSAYRNAPAVRTPGKKYCVCDGYANEAMAGFLQLDCVQAVQKWTSGNHAWNVILLTDGRTLYCDLTWFDNEHIDEQTGRIVQKEDYDWENITFDRELFNYSNLSYGEGVFEHLYGRLASEKRNNNRK